MNRLLAPDRPSVFSRLFQSRTAQQMNQLPGVWITAESIVRDGPADGTAASRRPFYLRRLQPGAPLPADVEEGAQRYDLVTRTEMPESLRRPAALAGAAITVAGAAAVAAVSAYGAVAILVGLGLLAAGIVGGVESYLFRPSADGVWVQAPPPPPEPSRTVPYLRRGECVALGVLSLAFLSVVALRWSTAPFSELAIAFALGAGLGALAIAGTLPRPSVGADFHRLQRFLDQADPSIPLPDDASLSGERRDESPS